MKGIFTLSFWGVCVVLLQSCYDSSQSLRRPQAPFPYSLAVCSHITFINIIARQKPLENKDHKKTWKGVSEYAGYTQGCSGRRYVPPTSDTRHQPIP